MFDLPDSRILYQALLDRDPRYEGRAWVGVTSTGVFCRLICSARKPKFENCQFYGSISDCLEAGFRACKRCGPLAEAAADDPTVQKLLTALDAQPHKRWSEADIVRFGYDPSNVRRVFKRQFGLTFLELARLRRLKEGFTTLRAGETVLAAQIESGFESPSAFRAAFAALIGIAPGAFRNDALLQADWIETPLGSMVAISCQHRLHLLEFVDRKALATEVRRLLERQPGGLGIGTTPPTEQVRQELQAFFAGRSSTFQTPCALHGTAFEREVWAALQQIPAGETRSYSDLAAALGRPSSTRAVARANGKNQLAIIVPCHRILAANGDLTGYGGGLWRKRKLITLETSYQERE
jgi:AraC family transcriptional regulator of adaptative response/methylated-DNA-[protein]-cysteine methyltransferase